MASTENASKPKKNRCKSAHSSHDNTATDKKLLIKRPKSMGRNLDILDRKYLELREIILSSITARLPVERLLLTFAMQENKRWEQILNGVPPRTQTLNQSIQARRIYSRAIGDIMTKDRGSAFRHLPPVYRPGHDLSTSECCARQNSKTTRPKKCSDRREPEPSQSEEENKSRKNKKKNKKNKKQPTQTSASSGASRSSKSMTSLSDRDRSDDSWTSRQRMKKIADDPSKIDLADDVYRWRNCSSEIKDWLREKNRVLMEKRREERKLASEKEEKLEMERRRQEAEKAEAREKARVWLDRRRKKSANVKSMSPVRRKMTTTCVEEAPKADVAELDFSEDAKVDILERSFTKGDDADDTEDRQPVNSDSGEENEAVENDFTRGETNHETNVQKDEQEEIDFGKLMADFCNSEDVDQREPIAVASRSHLDSNREQLRTEQDELSEALIRHEMDLNQNNKINEWVYDSGKVIENTETSDLADDKMEDDGSPILPEMTRANIDRVDGNKKSIRMTHFDLLRSQTFEDDDSDLKMDLEQFKRLYIHDDPEEGSKVNYSVENFHAECDAEGGGRSSRQKQTKADDDDEDLAGYLETDGSGRRTDDIFKLKHDFGKFNESYSSKLKRTEFPIGVPGEAEESSREGRPKTSRRRIQREETSEMLLN